MCTVCSAQHWQTLQDGLEKYTTELYTDTVSNNLFVGGVFKSVNNNTVWGIADWNGVQWDSLGSGIDDSSFTNRPAATYAIQRYGNWIYVGGAFQEAGNLNAPAFARWNGSNWDTVPGAHMMPFDVIYDAAVYNNELYVCGSFDSIGNTPANCIAKWNGITWQIVGNNYAFTSPNLTLSLRKMEFYNGGIYVSGFFFDPSGNPCKLAKWDGNAWIFFPNQLLGLGTVMDMKVYNNKLYLGGLFHTPANPNNGHSIISWNDTVWSGVGGGVQIIVNQNPTIISMRVHNGKLFCVGNFEQIGGISAMGLGTWDGTNWCGYDTDFKNNGQFCGATDIAFYNDTMYLGGGYQTADGDTVNYVAKWIGGSFIDTCGFISTGFEDNLSVPVISFFPNPASTNTTFQNLDMHSTELVILDSFGRKVLIQKLNGEKQIEISVADLANGMYFFQYTGEGGTIATGKFIVQH